MKGGQTQCCRRHTFTRSAKGWGHCLEGSVKGRLQHEQRNQQSRDKSSLPQQDIPWLMCHPDRVKPITMTTSNQLAKEASQRPSRRVMSPPQSRENGIQVISFRHQGHVFRTVTKTGPILTQCLLFPRPSLLPPAQRARAPSTLPSHHPSGPSLPDHASKTICHGLTPRECILALRRPSSTTSELYRATKTA